MSEDYITCEDLNNHMVDFRKIKHYFTESKDEFIKTKNYISDLMKSLEIYKENNTKHDLTLNYLQSTCNTQEKIISELNVHKGNNIVLNEQNKMLLEEIHKYEEKFNHEQSAKEREIEHLKQHYRKEVQNLKNELELVHASSDLQYNDYQNDIAVIKKNYEERLQIASEVQQNLKEKINKLNIHLSSNISVYQKKLFEMEQKCRVLEQNKFISNLKNVQNPVNVALNSCPNLANIHEVKNNETLNNNKVGNHLCSLEKLLYKSKDNNTLTNSANDFDKRFKFKKYNTQQTKPTGEQNDTTKQGQFKHQLNTNKNTADHTNVAGKNNKMPSTRSNTPENNRPTTFAANEEGNNSHVLHDENYVPAASESGDFATSLGDGAQPEFPVIKRRKLYAPDNYDHLYSS